MLKILSLVATVWLTGKVCRAQNARTFDVRQYGVAGDDVKADKSTGGV